ncbi:CD3324 family protein [Paenibacillus sp. 481]|uniref:CD3324 family protein n=1 Tax=Paenibacillus sp. 481 TaxID=2835869 RepID=UPI001E3BCAE4|nr:CD3324 family protein [Paenibacillus sp. 481]UHA73234.1 hypothetical protein KIK04_22060 [Paenibacillus sp. 481]
MKYQNAQTILPEELVRHIQQYVQGSYLYIPIRQERKKQWGESSGSRQMLQDRNAAIVQAYHSGIAVNILAQRYFLTEHSIRRIIREQRRVQL